MEYPKLENYIGYMAELNNGDRYLIILTADNAIRLISQTGCVSGYNYDEKLKSIYLNKFDIDAILLCSDPSNINGLFDDDNAEIVWERDEVLEVTMKDIELKFGCKVKIVDE